MLALYLFALAVTAMFIGTCSLFLIRKDGATISVRRWSELTSWFALVFGSIFGLVVYLTPNSDPSAYFHFSKLQAILVPYILLMGVLVKRFAYHYLQSDRHYAEFFLKIKLLICSLLFFVVLNHILFLTLTWMISGWIMYFLISHTGSQSALNSAKLAFNRFLIGDLLIIIGVLGVSYCTGSFYITDWLKFSSHLYSNEMVLWLSCIIMGSFAKTALIPYHKWLAHTLTAPTPVSAIMHAGFVNSGAVLLAKIAPLIIQYPIVMALIFSMGFISAFFGSAVMQVQADVKRYLTFSTIAQMGFMMMECGLGAFHLAILHLIVHGFFKARLFLTAGRVIEHRQAIRNVRQKQVINLDFSKSISSKLQIMLTIILGFIASCLIVFQIAYFKQHLLALPPVLLLVLGIGSLYVQTTLIKIKGYGAKGIIISQLFSISLILFYILYEAAAEFFLPSLNLTYVNGDMFIFNIATILLLCSTVLYWVFYLSLLRFPLFFKEKCYVSLLNAAGAFKSGSTFTERQQY